MLLPKIQYAWTIDEMPKTVSISSSTFSFARRIPCRRWVPISSLPHQSGDTKTVTTEVQMSLARSLLTQMHTTGSHSPMQLLPTVSPRDHPCIAMSCHLISPGSGCPVPIYTIFETTWRHSFLVVTAVYLPESRYQWQRSHFPMNPKQQTLEMVDMLLCSLISL